MQEVTCITFIYVKKLYPILSLFQLHNLIEELENSYIAKYHDRTNEQRFDNPDSWLIGDLPVITLEINRLEHEASSMSQTLADLRRQVNEFSHDVHIGYLFFYP